MTITITDRFRDDAVACLVQIVRDENASPAARAQAARDILAYSDGRPAHAQPIKAADLGRLSDAERQELLHALLTHYLPPGALEEMLRESVTEAVKLLPPPPTPKWGFTRGNPKPAPTQPAFTVQSSTLRAQQPAARLLPHASSRASDPAHSATLKSNSLDAELPPPRSPQHSSNPGHADGSNGSDLWSNLLSGYNAA